MNIKHSTFSFSIKNIFKKDVDRAVESQRQRLIKKKSQILRIYTPPKFQFNYKLFYENFF